MDDEFDRAARKHRLSQRQGALHAKQRQRQRQEAEALRAASSPSRNQSALPAAAPVTAAPAVEPTTAGVEDAKPAVVPVPEEIPCPGGPFTCFVCTEAKEASERFLPHRCTVLPETMCCKPCFVSWVESQIENDAAEIKCCHCDKALEPNSVQRLVDPPHWAKYVDVMLQRSLRRDASFVWCSKCPAGGWVDVGQPTSSCGWNCPECANTFVYCPHCRREHGTLPCKRFQQLRREVAFNYKPSDAQAKQSEGAVQRSSKMCPSCKMPIQKDGGCNFMDCPNCRRHFCWSCGRVLRGSHQAHKCDAGFEGSAVIAKTPTGMPCVELTRLFTNVLDMDNVELLNVDPVDLDDLREMLVPGLSEESRSPLFVGPSECDGEVLMKLPFNFQKAVCWEITHIGLLASHPPTPGSRAPRSIGLLANHPNATFSDFEDPTTVVVPLQDTGGGTFVAPLEQFRARGTFRRVIHLAIRLSVAAADGQLEDDEEAEVFINGLAVFGFPGEIGASVMRRPGGMYDGRADLIVSPVLTRKRWGEEAEKEGEVEADAG